MKMPQRSARMPPGNKPGPAASVAKLAIDPAGNPAGGGLKRARNGSYKRSAVVACRLCPRARVAQSTRWAGG